ncbi:hypothetical protein JVU11DRAFT_1972 [Chiua virens]|nr:hypothetical protein JVU11DRAFT_1972 [Chiua virens]
MWTLKRRSKKTREHEKHDDFIVPKFPTGIPTAAYYGAPYYPQMPSTYPTYYAPVQMGVVPPYGMQQPVMMPQGYVPMATYPTTVQPVIPASVTQLAPPMQMPTTAVAPAPPSARSAAQMPTPATAPTPAPIPVPVPAPVVPPPSAPPFTAPVIPRTPVLADPVIPSPPVATHERRDPLYSDLYRGPSKRRDPLASDHYRTPAYPPDSVRPRFTDFYRRPTDPPPRPPSVIEPVRPPHAGQPGRTPFNGPAPMPVPDADPARVPMPQPDPTVAMPFAPRQHNPLPPPPADIWSTSPYRQVLQNLPNEIPNLFDGQPSEMHVSMPEPEPSHPSSRLGGLFPFGSTRDKGKKPLRGLFRSRSTSGPDVFNDVGSSSGSRHGHVRAQTMTSIYVPAPGPNGSSSGSSSGASMPAPSHGPPIKFDHTGEFAGFVNHSNHRVMYKNKMYPTALHLLEAMKFSHRPELQERIRTCKDVNDMYPLSAGFQEHVRSDWGQVFLQTMEDVLYLKFKQHPGLRTLLLRTGLVDIVYADENTYWGEGAEGEGANELGKALTRVRERLRQEGGR